MKSIPPDATIAVDLAQPGSERTVLYVSGITDPDFLRWAIDRAGFEVDAIMVVDALPRDGKFVIKNTIAPFEIPDVKIPRRERPAHERIAAQKK